MAECQVIYEGVNGNAGIQILDNGAFFYLKDAQRVQWAHSCAETTDGRKISTKTAQRKEILTQDESNGRVISAYYEENELILEQRFFLSADGWISIKVILTDTCGQTVTRKLVPIITPYPDKSGKPVFLSLNQKMLLIPYDNDMWVRYESAPLRPGRTSYDVTAIFDPASYEGMVIGALDHNVWKNAITCAFEDARSVMAYSGVADFCTHDTQPHGCVNGDSVESARLIMMWCDDIRRGMETYGDLCAREHPPITWKNGVIFGYNTFSGLGSNLSLDAWQTAGDLIHNLPSFHGENGTTYINLDGAFGLNQERVRQMTEAFHARGQKVGTYAAPFVGHPKLGLDRVIDEKSGTRVRDLLLCGWDGKPLPAVDGLMPLDCTHPMWETYTRSIIRKIINEGFDYLKIDFISHGAMEGKFFNSEIKTGRMALSRAYKIILDEINKANRPIFISLSIAPLFPAGYGHARRCCCDSFGHIEDVQYVLNALTYGWWVSGRLYQYNDPDHTVLYQSVIDGRSSTTIEEARSRYNASVISGTVMLLSDDFGPSNANALLSTARAQKLADQPEINALARLGHTFKPIELQDGSTAVFTLKADNSRYIACFNFSAEPQTVHVKANQAGFPNDGALIDFNRHISWNFDGEITCTLSPMDSAILKLIQ